MYLTLHDLLQLHLQGLDGTGRVISCCALDPMDGETAVTHGCDIIILEEDDLIGVLDDSTAVTSNKAI